MLKIAAEQVKPDCCHTPAVVSTLLTAACVLSFDHSAPLHIYIYIYIINVLILEYFVLIFNLIPAQVISLFQERVCVTVNSVIKKLLL